MPDYITIDSGTTNTRICLVKDYNIADCIKFEVGAKDGTEKLKETIKLGIDNLLCKNSLEAKSIKRILASGMLTSELGLVNLPHISAPVGIDELHNNMHHAVMSDISIIPFSFVKGVKSEGETLEETDVMRGEETEFIGAFYTDGVYVFPGSHTKIITAKNEKITDFKTFLTGEMICSLAENTILSGAVDLNIDNLDENELLRGFKFCKKHGLGETLFKIRILKNFFVAAPEQLYSFFMGAVLKEEVCYLLSLDADNIVIGGKKQIKNALAFLLKEYSGAKITKLSVDKVNASTPIGLIKIFEGKKEL